MSCTNQPTPPLGPEWIQHGGFLPIIVGILVMVWGMAFICEEYSVPSITVFCKRNKFSDDITGAIFIGAGLSLPVLFASFIGLFVSQSAIGVGTVVGGNIFNHLINLSAGIYVAPDRKLKIDPAVFHRENFLYFFACLMVVWASESNLNESFRNMFESSQWYKCLSIHLIPSACLVFAYILYCIIEIYFEYWRSAWNSWMEKRRRKYQHSRSSTSSNNHHNNHTNSSNNHNNHSNNNHDNNNLEAAGGGGGGGGAAGSESAAVATYGEDNSDCRLKDDGDEYDNDLGGKVDDDDNDEAFVASSRRGLATIGGEEILPTETASSTAPSHYHLLANNNKGQQQQGGSSSQHTHHLFPILAADNHRPSEGYDLLHHPEAAGQQQLQSQNTAIRHIDVLSAMSSDLTREHFIRNRRRSRPSGSLGGGGGIGGGGSNHALDELLIGQDTEGGAGGRGAVLPPSPSEGGEGGEGSSFSYRPAPLTTGLILEHNSYNHQHHNKHIVCSDIKYNHNNNHNNHHNSQPYNNSQYNNNNLIHDDEEAIVRAGGGGDVEMGHHTMSEPPFLQSAGILESIRSQILSPSHYQQHQDEILQDFAMFMKSSFYTGAIGGDGSTAVVQSCLPSILTVRQWKLKYFMCNAYGLFYKLEFHLPMRGAHVRFIDVYDLEEVQVMNREAMEFSILLRTKRKRYTFRLNNLEVFDALINRLQGFLREIKMRSESELQAMSFKAMYEILGNDSVMDPDSESIEDTMFVVPQELWRKIIYYITWPLKILIYFTIPDVRKPGSEKKAILSTLMGFLWLAIITYILIISLTVLANLLRIDGAIMGITIGAWAASYPALWSTVVVARHGFGDIAVCNALGSNTFNCFLGLGLPWLCWILAYQQPYTALQDQGNVLSVLVLIIVVVIMYTMVIWNNYILEQWMIPYWLVVYVAYIAYFIYFIVAFSGH